MFKTIILYGGIAGLLLAVFLWVIFTLCYKEQVSFDHTTTIGYAGMLIAFSMIYFGIRSYRDNHGGGSVTFWKAVQIGLMITLVASVIHFAGYQAYNVWNPDFREFYYQKFREQMVSKLEKTASQEAIDEIKSQVRMVQTISEDPLYTLAFSVITLLPAGLIVTLVSAFSLRDKRKRLNV
jgi:hypothetical protein